MQEIIQKIINKNRELLGNNPRINKINVGFTNTIYNVNDSFIIKICTNHQNEENFQKEINFYHSNPKNDLIPKLYYSNTDKEDVPFFYEIIEKVNGVSLYNVWHTFSEEQREEIIKQICIAIKQFHANIGQEYDWADYLKKQFSLFYSKAKELHIFNTEEQDLINLTYSKFAHYLKSKDFVLIHNDLHFDNIFYNNGHIKLIDFERSMYAPRDFELDIIFRMMRKPWKFASDETEQYIIPNDYTNIQSYVAKYYPEIVNIPFLSQRLAIYDMVYFLKQLINCPDAQDLKDDVIKATKIVALENEKKFTD